MTRSPNVQTATLANVTFSLTSVTLFPAMGQVNRRIVVNDTDAGFMLISLNGAASTTNFTYKLAFGATLELPVPVFGGAITAIWVSATTGAARTTTY